jgi:hypothetical protein
VNYKVGEKY